MTTVRVHQVRVSPSKDSLWRAGGRSARRAALIATARTRVWPYGTLAVVLAIVMWPAWTTPGRLIAGKDLLLQHYPWQVLLRTLLAQGEPPFWNPYTFSGVPAFANPLMAYAYPPHWATVWLPAATALNWLIGLHVLLAGLGTAWCAARLGANSYGQFLAGVVYALGGAMTARIWAGHLALFEGIAWLPMATGLALGIRRTRSIVLLAVVTALIILAGQPEIAIFCSWWVPLWALLGAWRQGLRSTLLALGCAGLGLALGAGLAMVQILPTAALYTVSQRSAGTSWGWTTMASLPPWHLLSLLSPTLFGGPNGYWPGAGWEWHDRLFFVGLVPLLAALRARGRWRWACWTAAGLAIVLAFGRFTPLYAWAQAVLPGYQSFRVPPKHLAMASLAIALAAGLGVQRLHGLRVAIGCGVIVALLVATSDSFGAWYPTVVHWLGGSEKLGDRAVRATLTELAKPGLVSAIVALAVAALAALLPQPWAMRAMIIIATLELGLVLQPYRTDITNPERFAAELAPLRAYGRVAVVGDGGTLLGNFGTVWQVTQPAGYLNLFSSDYAQLAAGSRQLIGFDIPRDDPSIRLLGYGVIYDAERRSHKILDPPPLAWVARCAWPGGAREVRARTFPRESCITHPGATERQAIVAPGPAQILSQGSGWLNVTADGPGWLVTVQPWYPGWSAWIDGQATAVEIVDGALVGVVLPAGHHTVSLRYRPAGLEAGLLISLASASILAVLWVAARWRRDHALPSWLSPPRHQLLRRRMPG